MTLWDSPREAVDLPRPQGAVHRATLPNQVRVWVISQYDDARAALADERLSKDNAGLAKVICDQLAQEPDPATTAFEDAPRYDSRERMAVHRFTTEDVVYGGVVIPAGEIVLVWL